MTEFQLNTFAKVKTIQAEIEAKSDPTIFTLNKEIVKLLNELDTVRENCQHNWVNGICTVCGALEEDYGNESHSL